MLTTETLPGTADLRGMGDNDDNAARGEAIRRRRINLGINNFRDFAEATGLDKGTLGRAEKGEASEKTYYWLESWLDRLELETGMDDQPAAGPLKVTLHDVYGVGEMIVEGPVDADALAEAVGKILDRLKQREGN